VGKEAEVEEIGKNNGVIINLVLEDDEDNSVSTVDNTLEKEKEKEKEKDVLKINFKKSKVALSLQPKINLKAKSGLPVVQKRNLLGLSLKNKNKDNKVIELEV
jgi:hypothetical protein